MNIMKNKLLFTIARIQNCWEHHQDGSDLLKSHQSHLFCLVFNDLKWARCEKKKEGERDFLWTRWIDKYEERNVKNILQDDLQFRDYWKEINVLEIIHAAIQTEDKGNILIDKNHPAIFAKAPEGYFKKRGAIQGFLTSNHKFVDRKEALKIAIEAGQIDPNMDTIRKCGLLSENLWSDSGFKYDTTKGYYKEEETLKIKSW